MPFDMNQMMQNPMFNMGLGILAANQPGASFGQAVGSGMLAGQQNLLQMRQLKEKAAQRQLQSEFMKQQIAEAKRKAALQAQIQERAQALIGQPGGEELAGPTPTGARLTGAPSGMYATDPQMAPLAGLLAASGDTGGLVDLLKPEKPGKPSADMQAYLYDVTQHGYKGSFADWKKSTRKAGVTKVDVNVGLGKKAEGDLQAKSISAKTTIPLIDQLIADTQALPGGVGGIAEAREATGGIFGQLADVGVPGARTVAGAIKPEVTLLDPDAPGGQRTITGQSLRTQGEVLAIRLKPLMADTGPLSNQDRARLATAMGDVASADSERRLEALSTIRNIMTENEETIDNFLRKGGLGVPGERPPPVQGQVISGYKYIGGDPGQQSSWEKQ